MRLLSVVAWIALFLFAWTTGAEAGTGVIAESPGCGYPRSYMPETGRSGDLPGDFPVRGPAGALFGRTLDAVEDELVTWTVPMSDGAEVEVHRRILPVLEDVKDNLAQAALGGADYRVRSADTWGHRARTSVSHEAISYHGLGAAIDINATTNPYRRDGRLITDMPTWYVQAWEKAGMCWGGNWNYVKDPMHFSWVGPAASPSYSEIPPPAEPLTAGDGFNRPAGTHPVVFGVGEGPVFVGDAINNGAPDLMHIRPWGEHAVLEIASSRSGYGECSVWRYWLEDPPEGDPVPADVQGVGRPDLVYLDATGSHLVLRSRHSSDGYQSGSQVDTAVPTGATAYLFGDVDRDGADDLWSIRVEGQSVDFEIYSAASGFSDMIRDTSQDLSGDLTQARFATADRDVDGRADLMVLTPTPEATEVAAVGSDGALLEVREGPSAAMSGPLGFEDYDGDGHPDLQVLDEEGVFRVWYGNTRLADLDPTSWFLPEGFDCPDDNFPYHHQGTFADDEDSVYQADIEWLAATGVTRGCNPPFQDRFCPEDEVTRGQMAAFLVRALGLEGSASGFLDDDPVFSEDIGALAEAGITKGCNPPANDRFCPGAPVTRGQMAAFLNRAFDLDPGHNHFSDDEASVFEADIGALAGAGITRGCNPPANDRFCPNLPVTRGQMAAFLHRARGLFEVGSSTS